MTQKLRAVILVALLCGPTTAAADAFYDAYQRGLAAFKAQDYSGARTEFVHAYDLRAEPIVLFNIAQCYRLEQNPEQALAHYRRFLAESKIAEDLRAEAQRHVSELEALQQTREAQRKVEAEAGPKESDGSAVTMPTSPPVDRRPATLAAPPEPLVSRPPAEEMTGSQRRRRVPMASKIALGIGGAGAVGGVVLGILGSRAESDLQANPNATQPDADRVERYEAAINLSWGIAAAATLTGVAVYLVTPRHSGGRRAVVVAPSHGGWTASMAGSF